MASRVLQGTLKGIAGTGKAFCCSYTVPTWKNLGNNEVCKNLHLKQV